MLIVYNHCFNIVNHFFLAQIKVFYFSNRPPSGLGISNSGIMYRLSQASELGVTGVVGMGTTVLGCHLKKDYFFIWNDLITN